MKFLKRFVLLVLLLILALIGIAYVLPDSAHVERSARIEAPPEAVFPYLNNFRMFNQWSPWVDKDPQAQYSFEGPESGVGARLFWESDDPAVGNGSSMILESKPPERVTTRLDMQSQGTATAYFDIERINGASRVTWGFDIEFGNNLIWRYFGLMMDRWVGREYEQGLENLKNIVEESHG